MSEEITVRTGRSLFGMYDRFAEGIKNFYIMSITRRNIAVIVERDGTCTSYLAKVDQRYQPVEFSRSVVTRKEDCEKIISILDKVARFSVPTTGALGYDLVIYTEKNDTKRLGTDQPGLQELVDELFKIDGVLKYWE